MAAPIIPPPDQAGLLAPLLPALPAAAASTLPATKVLPLLSPILRQRVRLLSAASSEPWLRLLCYDAADAVRLAAVVRGPGLEPHPVSGQVEVDWACDVETSYRRLDAETLQALVALPPLGLAFRLVYCVADPDGGADGWRVGEVTVADEPDPFSRFGGAATVAEAERQFAQGQRHGHAAFASPSVNGDNDDDDDYWGRYGATPGQTPGSKRSPAPGAVAPSRHPAAATPSASADDDDYFSQYDHVQPALDSHDPDDEAQHARALPPLGLAHNPRPPSLPGKAQASSLPSRLDAASIVHPRPASSASSTGSHTVARLEQTAGKQEQTEFGVKQHVSRTIRSLYMLSRASGIARQEFARLVQTELHVLGIIDDDDDDHVD